MKNWNTRLSHKVELVTREFWTHNSWIWIHTFEFQLVLLTFNWQLVTRNPFFTISFIFESLPVDWENLIESHNGNVDQSYVNFLIKFNSVLDIHTPLKNLPKQILKFRNKPWITLGVQKSISIKNNLLTKYTKSIDLSMKNETQIKDKQYTFFFCLMRNESKISYFTMYFPNNFNDFKGKVQFLFWCNPQNSSVNVWLIKTIKETITKIKELCVFITLVKKTFKRSSFCSISNFHNGFIWNSSKV